MQKVPKKSKKTVSRKKTAKKKKSVSRREHPHGRTRKQASASSSARKSKSSAKKNVSAASEPPEQPLKCTFPASKIEQENREIWKDKWWYIPPDAQELFLLNICNGMRHKEALESAGLEWRMVSAYMTHDSEFAELYSLAKQMRDEFIQIQREEEADHRAIEGWLEPVFHKDAEVGQIRRFSDRLMEMRLKGSNPKKYADHHEHHHDHLTGGPERPKTIQDWVEQKEAAEKTTQKDDDAD